MQSIWLSRVGLQDMKLRQICWCQSELSEDAAMIYHLNAPDLVLVLFGMHPRTLVPQGRLSDPPPVAPGSTVMIFNVAGMGRNHAANNPVPPIALPVTGSLPLAGNLQLGPKFLGNFKLAKFDGVSRNWKQWDNRLLGFSRSINLIK